MESEGSCCKVGKHERMKVRGIEPTYPSLFLCNRKKKGVRIPGKIDGASLSCSSERYPDRPSIVVGNRYPFEQQGNVEGISQMVVQHCESVFRNCWQGRKSKVALQYICKPRSLSASVLHLSVYKPMYIVKYIYIYFYTYSCIYMLFCIYIWSGGECGRCFFGPGGLTFVCPDFLCPWSCLS